MAQSQSFCVERRIRCVGGYPDLNSCVLAFRRKLSSRTQPPHSVYLSISLSLTRKSKKKLKLTNKSLKNPLYYNKSDELIEKESEQIV